MKILSLGLENFRQFVGRQQIDFGDDPRIHLIYAANGAGKTTILNAFTWCLYKKLSRDFENPDDLVNKSVQRDLPVGGTARALVQVRFEHEGSTYVARRVQEVRKTEDGPEIIVGDELTLTRIQQSGDREAIGNPSTAIDQLLPERLHEFFFLNGERIEHLVKPTAYKDIEDAIKTLLGLEVLDRSRRHLEAVSKNLRRELGQVSDVETQEILEDLERYESDRTAAENDISKGREKLEELEDERSAIENRLRGLEQARALQVKRDALKRESESIAKQRKDLDTRSLRTVGLAGWLAFVPNLVEHTKAIIEANRDRGELPTTYKEQFILDLLERGECICGTNLHEGSPAWKSVESWRGGGGLEGVEESASRLGGFVTNFPSLHSNLHQELADSADKRRSLNFRARGAEEELDEISQQLSKDDDVDIANLETRRRAIESRIAQTKADVRSKQNEISELDKRRESRNKDLKKAQQKSAAAKIARRRVEMVAEVRDALSLIYGHMKAEVRSELDDKVKDVYQSILVKSYEPEISEDFQLRITDPEFGDERVALSVGENQVLTLSFVGALAAMARPRGSDGLLSGIGLESAFRGAHFPLVLDAPWGSLDTNYRKGVAAALPKLAEQVIVLVSKSQGLGEVRAELIGSASGQTVVHLLTAKSDAEEEAIQIDGADYPYISVAADGVERSELLEVGER